MVVLDGFSAFLQRAVPGQRAARACLVAYDYLQRMGIERGEYYALLLFTVAGMMLMAQAADLIVVFLALELLSIPLYVLAGFARPTARIRKNRPSSTSCWAPSPRGFLVYGIALVFGATAHHQRWREVVAAARRRRRLNLSLLLVGAALILVGLGFKVAAVPFHMWTPDVYQGAPTAVTAFMSVGRQGRRVRRAAARVRDSLPGPGGLLGAGRHVGLAALTMTWATWWPSRRTNIKRLLAYSSIAHAGYILMALPAAARARRGAGGASVRRCSTCWPTPSPTSAPGRW